MKSFSHYTSQQERISEFLNFCMEQLDLSDLPKIYLIDNKQAAMEAKSFGGYMPGDRVIRVNIAERHMADVFRTLAHELVHYRQDCDGRLDEMSGETGSEIENEANSLAGVIMRNFARTNDRLFEEKEVWDKPMPPGSGGKLRPSQKLAARRRAARKNRKYPNMIDNMWASNNA